MEKNRMRQEIQEVYRLADRQGSLPQLMGAIGAVLQAHPQALAHLTHSYRLVSADTGYTTAFALTAGVFQWLPENQAVDVEISGKEQSLLAVFQRKLPPLKALLLGKIKLKGEKAALLKLGEFL